MLYNNWNGIFIVEDRGRRKRSNQMVLFFLAKNGSSAHVHWTNPFHNDLPFPYVHIVADLFQVMEKDPIQPIKSYYKSLSEKNPLLN